MNKVRTTAIAKLAAWRNEPVMLLFIMAAAMPLSFSIWRPLLDNFTIEVAQFTGREIGMLQSLREIPGFLAFTAVFVLLIVREQTFALVSLLLLGIGTSLTGFFPSAFGLYCTTILMSIGFHYYETMNQSLTLQWIDKDRAPEMLGRLLAVGSTASLVAYGLIYLLWLVLGLPYEAIYLAGGGLTIALALIAFMSFPKFEAKVEQHKHLVLRKRYWLYYALTFLSGARRQIFVVFAGFLMVEKFGFRIELMTTLYVVTQTMNIWLAPKIGRLIHRWGERRALTCEYIALIFIFTSYAFVDDGRVAAGLYLLDHVFFALAIAIKTYFQKIAHPADIAPTAGVAFSINHIAAVGLPAILGLIWIVSNTAVFLIGSGIAMASLVLSQLVPFDPKPDNETTFSIRKPVVPPAPAE